MKTREPPETTEQRRWKAKRKRMVKHWETLVDSIAGESGVDFLGARKRDAQTRELKP